MKKKKLLPIALICLFTLVGSLGFAQGENPHALLEREAGIDTAACWLKLTDAKNYNASWQSAAQMFKSAIAPDQWAATITPVRDPLGKVVSRDLSHDQLTTTLPGMPDGSYLLLRYVTRFANKAHAVESITLIKESDGTWRVAGYFIK
jgi:hypothetical protein